MSLWKRWLALLETREAGTSMAIYRILVCASVLWAVWEVMLSPAMPLDLLGADFGGYRNIKGNHLVRFLGGPSAPVIWSLASTCTASVGLLMVGVGGPVLSRVLAFIGGQSLMGIVDLNGHAGGSYDELMLNSLWLLVLCGPTRTLSVECRLSTGSWTSDRAVLFWPRLLVICQMILMYWTTGLQKVSAYWTPGGDFSALYYILQQPTWHVADMSWLAWVFPLTQIGTAVTWFWEVLAPLWLIALIYTLPGHRGGRRWQAVRSIYTFVGLFFHISVHFMMDIGPFSWASMALYPAVVHPHEWGEAWRWLRRKAERSDAGPRDYLASASRR